MSAITHQEQDVRVRLLNTLLTTPHRKLEEIWPVHADMVKTDPRFYVRLAAWYQLLRGSAGRTGTLPPLRRLERCPTDHRCQHWGGRERTEA